MSTPEAVGIGISFTRKLCVSCRYGRSELHCPFGFFLLLGEGEGGVSGGREVGGRDMAADVEHLRRGIERLSWSFVAPWL